MDVKSLPCRRTSLLVGTGITLSLILSACSSSESPRLAGATDTVHMVATDPAVRQYAPVEVDQARETLAQAESASGSERDHLAGLAEQRAQIAVERANARRNTAQVAQLGEQRERQENELLRAQLAEMQRGRALTLGDILFNVDQATLTPGGERQLQHVAEALRNEPNRQIRIEGHTDSTGSAEHNRDLSLRRAETVRQALMKMGIDGTRIQTQGMGAEYPVASNATAAGRQQNRRVDIGFSSSGVAQR